MRKGSISKMQEMIDDATHTHTHAHLAHNDTATRQHFGKNAKGVQLLRVCVSSQPSSHEPSADI